MRVRQCEKLVCKPPFAEFGKIPLSVGGNDVLVLRVTPSLKYEGILRYRKGFLAHRAMIAV
ncbi:MAG: hypothetical protein ABSG25_09030 [Bryobacteraceae bacterium]